MPEFIDERIEVETAEAFPRPVRFVWRGKTHDVTEILSEHVDTGYGQLGPRSRKWFTRRHRRYFVVRDSEDAIFRMYNEYSDRRRKTWWLVEKWPPGEQNPWL